MCWALTSRGSRPRRRHLMQEIQQGRPRLRIQERRRPIRQDRPRQVVGHRFFVLLRIDSDLL